MNPLDIYTKPWTGWDESEKSEPESNPFLDQLMGTVKDFVHDAGHDAMKDYFCNGVMDEAVRQGMMSRSTADTLLPVVEFVYDKIDPCSH